MTIHFVMPGWPAPPVVAVRAPMVFATAQWFLNVNVPVTVSVVCLSTKSKTKANKISPIIANQKCDDWTDFISLEDSKPLTCYHDLFLNFL